MTQPLYDPVWLERMYNNRALVPDHMSYLDRWAQVSARVRASQPCSLDLPYGDGVGGRWTFSRPPASGPGACR